MRTVLVKYAYKELERRLRGILEEEMGEEISFKLEKISEKVSKEETDEELRYCYLNVPAKIFEGDVVGIRVVSKQKDWKGTISLDKQGRINLDLETSETVEMKTRTERITINC